MKQKAEDEQKQVAKLQDRRSKEARGTEQKVVASNGNGIHQRNMAQKLKGFLNYATQ